MFGWFLLFDKVFFCSFLPLLLNLVLHFLRVKKIHRIPKAPNFHKQPCHLYAIELAVLLFPTPSFLLLLLLSISILHIVGSPDFPMMWTPCCDRFFLISFPCCICLMPPSRNHSSLTSLPFASIHPNLIQPNSLLSVNQDYI